MHVSIDDDEAHDNTKEASPVHVQRTLRNHRKVERRASHRTKRLCHPSPGNRAVPGELEERIYLVVDHRVASVGAPLDGWSNPSVIDNGRATGRLNRFGPWKGRGGASGMREGAFEVDLYLA